MLGRSRPLALACATAAWLLASPAGAQGAPAPGAKTEADTLFAKARSLMKDQRYGEACPLLAEANRLDPTSGTAFNLGRCHELTGKTATASKNFEQAIALAEKEQKPKRVEAAKAALEKAKGRLSFLVVNVPPAARVPGLTIFRGDVAIPESSWGNGVAVDPGPYTIRATAPGYREKTESVTAKPGPAREVVTIVGLEALPKPKPAPASAPLPAPTAPPPPEGLSTLQVVAIGVGVLGVASVGAGAGLGVVASSKNDESLALCNPAAASQCTAEGKALRDDAFTFATVSTVLFAAGGAAIAAAVPMFLLTGHDEDASTTVEVGLAPLPAGAMLRGRW